MLSITATASVAPPSLHNGCRGVNATQLRLFTLTSRLTLRAQASDAAHKVAVLLWELWSCETTEAGLTGRSEPMRSLMSMV